MRAVVCFVAIAIALAYVAEWTGASWNGANQGSHYALVKSLSEGTPYLDSTRGPVGSGTLDLGRWHGHLVSDKAPGLAFFVLPAYAVLRGLGLHDATPEMRWSLGIWGVVLPALLLLLLVRRVADELVPRHGLATAATLGLGTLFLPFATLFFSHVLSALLCFAAFAVLLAERGSDRPRLLALAGLLGGLAVTTEYPNVIAVAVLGGYALFERRSLGRLVAYGAGALAGVLPLLAYNWWTFGVPWRFSRSADVLVLRYNNPQGFGGLTWPTPHRLWTLLFDLHQGLIPTAPVLLCGIAGTVLLVRSAHRAEGVVVAALTAAYTLYNAGYYAPFGGASPGPRYLVAMLPFLALGFAPSYRRFPRTTVSLAALSIARSAIVTATGPLAVPDHQELRRFADRDFVPTVLDSLHVWSYPHPVAKIWVFFVAVGVGSVAALWPYVRSR